MGKKEQTNGGSKNLKLTIGEFTTDENEKITMPPEHAKQIEIANEKNLENNCIEINLVEYDVEINEKGEIIRRAKDGKVLTTSKNKTDKEVEAR